MLRNIQNDTVYADGTKKVSEAMKRGTFVTVNASGEIVKATTLAGAYMLDRGLKLTQEVAMGFPVSQYDEAQDVVDKGEYAELVPLVASKWATSEYADDVVDGISYLTVGADGKLKKSTDPTILVFNGFMNDGYKADGTQHKLAVFTINPAVKLA